VGVLLAAAVSGRQPIVHGQIGHALVVASLTNHSLSDGLKTDMRCLKATTQALNKMKTPWGRYVREWLVGFLALFQVMENRRYFSAFL